MAEKMSIFYLPAVLGFLACDWALTADGATACTTCFTCWFGCATTVIFFGEGLSVSGGGFRPASSYAFRFSWERICDLQKKKKISSSGIL